MDVEGNESSEHQSLNHSEQKYKYYLQVRRHEQTLFLYASRQLRRTEKKQANEKVKYYVCF